VRTRVKLLEAEESSRSLSCECISAVLFLKTPEGGKVTMVNCILKRLHKGTEMDTEEYSNNYFLKEEENGQKIFGK
jgi:hypothetical protein